MNAVQIRRFRTAVTVDTDPKDDTAMLLQENLARARMQESQRSAAARRLARRLGAARRWRRLSAWASRRAALAVRDL